MPKIEVAWTRESGEAEKRQIRVRTRGDSWVFSIRAKRFDVWQELAAPPLEDWLKLLDGVRRRRRRQLATPGDETRLLQHIRKLFPDATID